MTNREPRYHRAEQDTALDDARSFQGYARSASLDTRFADSYAPSVNRSYDTDIGSNPGIGDANGAGKTQLINQTYNTALARYEFSGRQDTDAVLIGSRYTISNLTFSFPSSGSQYADTGYAAGTEPATQKQFNAQQQQAVRYALHLVASYCNLTFTEITETDTTHANLRLSQTDYSQVGSAYGNFPSSKPVAGDVWFSAGTTNPQPFYATPAVGNWGQATIMHELGHTLGLKHGHQDYTNDDLTGSIDGNPDGSARHGTAALPRDHDGQDWSLMTYAADPTIDPNNTTFEGEGFNQPQTYMQDDIAALQYLYGANFNTQSGNTTYSWNPNTGTESINGVAQTAPSSNKISETVWDGNGVDTYDLSNYTTNLKIDLTPGAFSTFSADQLVNHEAASGGTAIAVGNVANALLYNNDTRSLIENAVGGTGTDLIRGNQANNTLTGGAGTDTLIGDIGNDKLYGGTENDTLYGDAAPATPSGVGRGSGQMQKASGAGNVDPGHAIDLNPTFALTQNSDILNSTTIPHVTVSATGDGNDDFYKITVIAGAVVTLDIDHTNGIDSYLAVYDANGNLVIDNDDSPTSSGAGGSTNPQDSFLTFTATTSGTYYLGVGAVDTNNDVTVIDPGATYQLQVSVADLPPVGSGSGDDILDGGSGADTMAGGAGNDTYYVDNVGDKVIEKASDVGTDTILSTISYTLAPGLSVERLGTAAPTGTAAINLTGNEIVNAITGNAGANALDGKAGADTMTGLGGDDLYYVDNVGDRVIEAVNGGDDRVLTSISYTLAAGQEIERLTTTGSSGTGAINLTGNEFANIIQGNAGANILDGKAGADMLYGFGGNDTYYVDNTGDRVFEAANGGTDRVLASVSYALSAGQEIEALTTTSVSGTTAINLTGNEFAQIVQGNAGANILNGGGGADTMTGYAGDDIYYVDNAADRTIEAAGGGSDRVLASVSYALGAGQEIERLQTTSSTGTAAINLTGNAFGQIIQGNAGTNVIDGGLGADTLYGFGGADTFGFTTTLGGGNIDRIADFANSTNSVHDRISLSRTIFSGLNTGTSLAASAFKDITGGAALDADERILYNHTTGALFYDADGSGSAAAIQFATMDGKPTLSSADFTIAG